MIPHKFIYIDDEIQLETPEISGHVIVVEFLFTSAECSLLETDYIARIYFEIPDEYPFEPPNITLNDPIDHPLVDWNIVRLNDYCVVITFPNLVMNVYYIILEALNNGKNDGLLNFINNKK
jgi:ubiquitin-protein ligase